MSERTGRKRLDDLRCIGSVVGADAASEGWRGVEKEGQIRAFSDVGVCENNQGVGVIEPFYSVAAFVVIPFLEHELEVAGLEFC